MFRATGKKAVKDKLIHSLILFILILQMSHFLNGQNIQASKASDNYMQEGLNGFNVTLCVKDWDEKTGFEGLKVIIYDLKERIASTHFSNRTGHVDLRFIPAGSYAILVQKDERTVGYEKINVMENGNFTVRTWAYDLNLTLIDDEGKPLTNHTVILQDQTVQKPVTVGVGNGTRTTFYIGHPYIIKGTVNVYLNGILATNYTLDYLTGKLTFNIPPSNGTEITADYSYWNPATEDIRRAVNSTVLTEEAGPLVAEAETDENGTVSFRNVWNGTYRLTVLGKERWIEEYILGKKVLTRLEPAKGDFIIKIQGPTNKTIKCVRSDLTLQFVTKSKIPVRNSTVEVRNREGHLLYKDQTNSTGFVQWKNIYVMDGLYAVSAHAGERVVGREVINATEPKTFIVECWTSNLTVTCLDQEGKPLPNHLVFLYDQLVFHSPENFTLITDHAGSLVNLTWTDGNGTAFFKDLWNGTYQVRVMAGKTVGSYVVNLQKTESVTVKCNKTYMALTLLTWSGEPLPEATVLIYDDDGNLFLKGRTDQKGRFIREDVYLDDYMIHVEWMGIEVWSGTMNLYEGRERTIRCQVYRFTLQCKDLFGKELTKADVTLKREISRGKSTVILRSETDEKGSISLLLPYGSYEVSCSYGVYSGSTRIILDDDQVANLACSIRFDVWTPMVAVALPLVILTIFLERRSLRIPLEIRRYKSMLSKLESMYQTGQVEYKIYRKIKEELEAKIMELGGREIR